jgi:hypothetical protein
MFFGAFLLLAGVFAGGWLIFKGKNAVQGEGFFKGVPKGEVFHIPDGGEDMEETEAEKSVLNKVSDFMKVFGGQSNAKS